MGLDMSFYSYNKKYYDLKTVSKYNFLPLERIPDHLKNEVIKVFESEDKQRSFYSLAREFLYLRKFNALHGYIVNNFNNKIDDCEPIELSKEDIEIILKVLKDDSIEPQWGCFFGSLEKDDWYHECRKEAIKAFNYTLKLTDFRTTGIYYQASW